MKSSRHMAILKIIKEKDVETQYDLARLLQENGYNVTQATVSRDIKLLNLIKVSENGRQKYVVYANEENGNNGKYNTILKEGFVSMDMAQNILVIKTVSGMAMAVAAALDVMNFHELVGTIAGDDTIMCVIRTIEDTRLIMDKIQKIIK
ncbi:arginine repressor [Eshraghiella crossota]|uniref:arginine repressor n=1 Tax=Eshraghiella crossota TaxID=45851 RepID=UPI003F7D5ED4